MRLPITVAVVLLASIIASPVMAAECLPVVRDGWVRLPPAPMPMMAGFARIENACKAPAEVVGASSPSFGAVELHETRVVDGVSRMRHVPRLRIDGNGVAILRPGGLHLMLMDPTSALKPGSHVAIDFTLKDGRHVLGDFEVRNAQP